MAGVEILGRQRVGSVIAADRDGPPVGVNVGDDGDGAVADTEAALVAQGHDLIAGLVGATVDLADGTGEEIVFGDVASSACVEVVDVVPSWCDHEGGVSGEASGPPVRDHHVSGRRRGRAGDDAPAGVVGVEGGVDVAVAQTCERGTFPRFVLTTIRRQPERFESFPETA